VRDEWPAPCGATKSERGCLPSGNLGAVAALVFLSSLLAASAQDGPFLVLVDVQAEQPAGNWVAVTPGHVSQASSRGNFFTEHSWSEPPRNIDRSGFDLAMTATVTTANGHIYWGGTAFRTRDFEWNTAERTLEPVAGSNYLRIRNRWKPNRDIHTENGQVEAGRINEGWPSARWWVLQ
jgi:hypothetical protein